MPTEWCQCRVTPADVALSPVNLKGEYPFKIGAVVGARERAARVRALQEGMRKPDARATDSSVAGAPATAETPAVDAAAPADTAPVDPASARREAELAVSADAGATAAAG